MSTAHDFVRRIRRLFAGVLRYGWALPDRSDILFVHNPSTPMAHENAHMSYRRYAVYYLPSDPIFSEFGARWLGWDVERGRLSAPFALPGLADVTSAPRRYGFHATLKPPFHLAEGADPAALAAAVGELAAKVAPAECDGLGITAMGRFLALTPSGDTTGLARVAAACVSELDGFRAPMTETELARRRERRLTDRQEAHLERWGYPYVMEDFRFHMTLTGRLAKAEIDHWRAIAARHMPALPTPFALTDIALVGEDEDGMFHLIRRCPLG